MSRGEGKENCGREQETDGGENKKDGYFETVQNVEDFGTDNIGEEKRVKGKWCLLFCKRNYRIFNI